MTSFFLAESVLLSVVALTMIRRGQRLRSLAAVLVGLSLSVPVIGHLLRWAGVAVYPAAVVVAVVVQAAVVAGIVWEEVAETRAQSLRRRSDRVVEQNRRASARARSEAYHALRVVEERHGWQ